MLFCALNNIRKTSLFPRDPQRLTPWGLMGEVAFLSLAKLKNIHRVSSFVSYSNTVDESILSYKGGGFCLDWTAMQSYLSRCLFWFLDCSIFFVICLDKWLLLSLNYVFDVLSNKFKLDLIVVLICVFTCAWFRWIYNYPMT